MQHKLDTEEVSSHIPPYSTEATIALDVYFCKTSKHLPFFFFFFFLIFTLSWISVPLFNCNSSREQRIKYTLQSFHNLTSTQCIPLSKLGDLAPFLNEKVRVNWRVVLICDCRKHLYVPRRSYTIAGWLISKTTSQNSHSFSSWTCFVQSHIIQILLQ